MCSRKSIELKVGKKKKKVANPTLGGSVVKNLPINAGAIEDLGSNPGSGRSPGVGNGSPLQYSCLENPMDRGAWQTTYSPWGRKESDMTEQAHTRSHTQTHTYSPTSGLICCVISGEPLHSNSFCPVRKSQTAFGSLTPQNHYKKSTK